MPGTTTTGRGLIVFDESGDTGTMSIPESYSTAGIYCGNEHDLELVTKLDSDLRAATGRRDYKYKHVAENDDARTLVAAAFRKHSTVLAIAIASVSSGIGAEERRSEAMVRGKVDDHEATPERTRRNRRENLDYFTQGLAHATHGIAQSKQQSIDVWWDRRSDMQRIRKAFEQVGEITKRLADVHSDIPYIRRVSQAKLAGISIEFRGDCDTRTRPASRVAGVVAADLLRVADATLPIVTPHLRENDALMALPRAAEQYFENGGILVGHLSEPFGQDSCRLRHMPLFRAYAHRLAAARFSIWEPGGRSLSAVRRQGRWYILQVPD